MATLKLPTNGGPLVLFDRARQPLRVADVRLLTPAALLWCEQHRRCEPSFGCVRGWPEGLGWRDAAARVGAGPP